MPPYHRDGIPMHMRQAAAKRRLIIIQECANNGRTKEQAAAAAGLTPQGMNSLLYREFNTTVWPPNSKLTW